MAARAPKVCPEAARHQILTQGGPAMTLPRATGSREPDAPPVAPKEQSEWTRVFEGWFVAPQVEIRKVEGGPHSRPSPSERTWDLGLTYRHLLTAQFRALPAGMLILK